MPRFFVDELCETTVIYGEDANHIARSLRMRVGEHLTLCDGNCGEAQGEIVSLSPDAVTVRLGQRMPSQSEPALRLSLYIALPKGDKADWMVQKCVELGAHELIFVLTERCISRPDKKEGEKKIARLQRIANEAAGQSGRGILPRVEGILPFGEALARMGGQANSFLLYEGECQPLRAQPSPDIKQLSLFTGCEGGFSPDEVRRCIESSVLPASLGKRILRCETAPVAATSAVMFYCGQMD